MRRALVSARLSSRVNLFFLAIVIVGIANRHTPFHLVGR
jgi:hypothetical protein